MFDVTKIRQSISAKNVSGIYILFPLISLVHEFCQHVIVCNFTVPESLYLNAACTDDFFD